MKRYKITNFVIVVLVVAAVYQTGELWLAGTTGHNFFSGILQTTSRAGQVEQGNGSIFPASCYVIGNGGSAFSVQYPEKIGKNQEKSGKNEILKAANDILIEVLLRNVQDGEVMPMNWKSMLQSRCLIFRYDFPLSPADYSISPKGKKTLASIQTFDSIAILPARHSGEETLVFFINSDTNQCVQYRNTSSKAAPFLYDKLTRPEGDMVYIATGQKTTSSILKRNLFLPQLADLPYFYSAVEEVPVFEQNGTVNRTTLENTVEKFFKNFSADWSMQDEDGNFEFSDNSVIVKYSPNVHVLEYYSYDTFGTEKNQAPLSKGYAISCNFMQNDASLHNNVFLSNVIQRSNETIYCFDYTVDNLPIYLATDLQKKIGMKHAIEITVRGQSVKKYRRLAVNYMIKESPTERLNTQFIDALDEANKRYQEKVEKRIIRDVENIALGYYADGNRKINLRWFVTLYDHDFVIDTDTALSTPLL